MFKSKLKKFARFILSSNPENFITVKVSQINYGGILKDKNVVVTGGGKGIGYYIAEKCIKEGANVIISGRDEKVLDDTAKKLGERCSYIKFDISNISDIKDFFEKCEKKFNNPIDCFINNAGISLHEGDFMHVTEETFDKQIDINLKGTYFLCKEYLERKLKEKEIDGNLIIISSETGNQCYDIPYGLTKTALNSLTKALSRRVYKDGIRVNAVAPGVTLTDMTKDYAGHSNGNLSRDNAAGRVFLPEEVAEVVVFLLSDASKCISGEIIHTNAGNHLKVFWNE